MITTNKSLTTIAIICLTFLIFLSNGLLAVKPMTMASHTYGPTLDEWRTAFKQTFEISNIEKLDDGITKSIATFPKSVQLGKSALMTRDAFKKITTFTFGNRSQTGDSCPFANSYVSVPDGKLPSFFLEPCFFGKTEWLLMNKIEVMMNGRIILEREFGNKYVRRETYVAGNIEQYDLLVQNHEIELLRKINADSTLTVKLIGAKGNVILDESDSDVFKSELRESLKGYIALRDALEEYQVK